jgi:DASH complex subunit DAD2
VRASSAFGGNIPTQQTSNLQARINEKKMELESLKQLRDLSAGLAGQMQQLEEKLATLSNGTEAVAAVMGNWATVLRAIHMASGELSISVLSSNQTGLIVSYSEYTETKGE